MKKFIISAICILASLFSVSSFAADYTACKAAVATGKVSWYVPSHIAAVTKVGPGEEVRTLEAPMCVHMDAVGGWKVVPIAAGQQLVFPKGSNQPVRHPKCNNAINGGQYVGNLPGTVAAPAAQAGGQQVAQASQGTNSFKEIKLGERMCIVHLHGGQYTDGQPIATTFRSTQAECDEWELTVRARYMQGSVNNAVVTYDSNVPNPASPAAYTGVLTSSSPNWCVRAGKRYDCKASLAVIRADGAIACRAPADPAGPGDQPCTGIQ
jgi:hypothetical protein